MKITITGPAKATRVGGEEVVQDVKMLKALDGLAYDEDSCANYIESAPLADLGIQGGIVRLAFSVKEGLRVTTEYRSPKALTEAQLKKLTDFTRAQWSDGIGEGEFLHRNATKMDVDIDPEGRKATITTKQIDDGIVTPPPPQVPLIKAILNHKPEKIEALIAKGADVNAKDRKGNTALHLACLRGYFAAGELLVKHGADVNAIDEDGQTALHRLAMCNTIDHPATLSLAEELLKHGAKLEARDGEGYTALAWAANRGKLPLMKWLLSHGADPNSRDKEKSTVLMMVQNLKPAEILLEHGADPTLRNNMGQDAAEHALFNSWPQSKALAQRYRTHRGKK